LTSPIVINSPVGGFKLGKADDGSPAFVGSAVVAGVVVAAVVVPGAATVVAGAVVAAGAVVVADVTGAADLLLPHDAAINEIDARPAAHQRRCRAEPDRERRARAG
jgi:hypothetical protein